MSERENILGRIREALSVPAPVPGHGPHDRQPEQSTSEREAAPHIPEWLPAAKESLEERLEQFRANAMELKADFRLVTSEEELVAQLQEIAKAEGWKKIATHANDLAECASTALNLPALRTDGGYQVGELESCDAGITACDALIAQTGSVLVTSRSAGGRALSVLPPHHVVVARREQVLPDLPAAFALLKETYGAAYPSFMGLISGPSRTGDIERILVLGAHGPKKLTIFCV